MNRTHSHTLPFVLLLSFAIACSGTSSSTRADGELATTEKGATTGDGSSGATATSTAPGKALKFDSVSPRAVTALQYVAGRLAVGFSDGGVVLLGSDGSVAHSKVAKVFSVAAIAPSGELALLNANPPVIVNTKGDLILQMNTVSAFESAVFGNDGVTMYVADKEGKVRIWGQPHSFEEDQHKEKLENYLNRQAPDFHVEFPPIRGPIHVTDTNKLIVVDNEGAVRIWDPTRPSTTKRIMLVGGGARSIASANGHIFVTSSSGAFKVGLEDGSGFLPWSKDARAAFVASGPMTAGKFYTLDTNKIESRDTQTGEVLWTVATPDGHPCGVTLSPDAGTIAACIGNFVATFDAKTGASTGYGYRADGDFTWHR